MNRRIIIFYLYLISFSCNQQQDQAEHRAFAPKTVVAKGYVVPINNVPTPIVKVAGIPKVIPAGKPLVVTTNSNVHPAGTPKILLAGIPRIVIPGHGGYLLPKKVSASASHIVVGTPEVVIAQDATSKDQNPKNLSSFGKLQGLKHGLINCMLEDKDGNLWFGTDGGGASKYDGRFLTHFTQSEGLTHNDVNAILQDKNGNLWFATDNGVLKYDGESFSHFTKKRGLASDNVESILQDKNGNIWFGTYDGGVSVYDGHSFINFTEQEGLPKNIVYSMMQDKDGNIWIGSNGGGVTKYDGQSFAIFTQKEGLPNNFISSIIQDKNGYIWFGTDGGVSKFDGKYFTNYSQNEGLSNNYVESIRQDNNGYFWFGTNGGGVSKFDGKSFTYFTQKEGLSNNFVETILQDKSGNLWFGTYGGGVSKYDIGSFTNFTEKDGLSNNIVSCIVQDKAGNFWLGTEGGGVSKFDGKSFTHFTQKEGLANNFVECMLQDQSGNLWFGTYGGGVIRFDGKSFRTYTEKEGLSNNIVLCMLEDKEGNLWFGTNSGGVSKFDGKSFTHLTERVGLTNNIVSSILQDRNGNLWFATEGGATRYDGKSFTHFTEREGLSNNVVTSILQDDKGNLWFGTNGGGVSEYDGNSFTHFTEKEGLTNNYVESILQDNKGNLWFGTSFGLSKLTKEKLAEISERSKSAMLNEGEILFKNFTYEDGFLGVGCSHNAICEDNTGMIWIGSNDRLTLYHPEGETTDTIVPNIQLTTVDLFNENIPWGHLIDKKDTVLMLRNGVKVEHFEFDGLTKWYGLPEHLVLAHNNNSINFNFIGITQKSPKKVKYQYMLDGLENDWSGIVSSNTASYGNLPSGSYTFKVRAMNSEGYWSNEFNYAFTIRPPWWKAWWAYTLYLMAILVSISLYIRSREKGLIRRQRFLEQTVEKRTAELVEEKKEVEKQKERSDKLLLNILPAVVAEELKQNGAAEARQFTEVTVMFTDFKGFTQVTEKLSPGELVEEIDTSFKAFDRIISKYGIEKIKTIGDSYMCAGGLPLPNETNPEDVVHAAIEIHQFIQQRLAQRIKEDKERLEIRIGIHTGPVVAGIVGINKFAYDIWGDTVNIASRMESSGEAGKINISGSTYELVKDKFNCRYRGKIEAKNKGMIDMYFVEGEMG